MQNSTDSFQIAIYSDDAHSTFFNWAKTFYLMLSSHPILFVTAKKLVFSEKINEDNVSQWIDDHLIDFPKDFKGLIVPVTVRPLVEIDFQEKTNSSNKLAIVNHNLPIISISDPQKMDFKMVNIDEVFEDMNSTEGLLRIKDEMEYMQNHLFMAMT